MGWYERSLTSFMWHLLGSYPSILVSRALGSVYFESIGCVSSWQRAGGLHGLSILSHLWRLTTSSIPFQLNQPWHLVGPQSSTNGLDMLPIRCILLPAIRNLSCPGDRNKPLFQTTLKKKKDKRGNRWGQLFPDVRIRWNTDRKPCHWEGA